VAGGGEAAQLAAVRMNSIDEGGVGNTTAPRAQQGRQCRVPFRD